MDKNDDEILPDYIQQYLDAVEYEGYPEFVGIARQHSKAIKDYDELIYPRQTFNQNIANRINQENKKFDREVAIEAINATYRLKALELAKTHGYKEAPVVESQDKNLGHEQETNAADQKTTPQKPQAQLSERELKIQKFKIAQQQIEEIGKQRGNGIEPD